MTSHSISSNISCDPAQPEYPLSLESNPAIYIIMADSATDHSSRNDPTIANMSTSDSTGREYDQAVVANGNGIQPGTPDGFDNNEKGTVADPSGTDEETEVILPASPRRAHGIVWILIVTSILMANFLFATDNTIAANIQPAVIKDFQSLNKLAWLGVAFLAASWGTNFFW